MTDVHYSYNLSESEIVTNRGQGRTVGQTVKGHDCPTKCRTVGMYMYVLHTCVPYDLVHFWLNGKGCRVSVYNQ